MIRYNLHQHSYFSDGAEAPEAYIQKAIELEMAAVGFTEHSPLPFPTHFSLKEEKADEYVSEMDRLKEKFKHQITIYRGLEIDFIPGFSENFTHWRKKLKLDYAIGSIHLIKPENNDELWFIDGPKKEIYDDGLQKLFGGNIKKAVKTYFRQVNQMIESQKFEIVGHMDKIRMHNQNRYFTEEDNWYQDLIMETLHLIKEKDLIVEVNTRGMYKKRADTLFPDGFTLQQVSKLNIPVIISSDAHHPEELDLLLEFTVLRLKEFDIHEVQYFENKNWISIPLA
ncbi:MAG: histidinol-phosphatase HisJ [Bacteroidales bacterium]|nr:histidinol-phosphatase HisJ [Bacteroidales bacterium]